MSTLKIRSAGYAAGAELRGVDASKPLDRETIDAIRRAVLDHIVVYLPGQQLDADRFVDFCEQFGELDVPNTHVANRHPDHPAVYVQTNREFTIDGKLAPATTPMTHWHTDFTQNERPATITFLVSKERPEIGGDTMFANQYMAYDALSPAYQRTIESLSGYHDFIKTKPAIVHPLVRVHPETGRKTLRVVERLRKILGMTEEESAPILDFLKEHMTRPEFIYRHRWSVDDLVIWDNRCSVHAVVANFDRNQLRSMLRASLVGPKIGQICTDDADAGAVSFAGAAPSPKGM